MAYDGKLLSQARDELNRLRQKNEAEHERRLRLAYEKIDDLEMIDSRLRSQMTDTIRLTLSRDPDLKAKIAAIERDNRELQEEKAEMLAAAGFPSDYLNDIFSCPVCRDTGYIGQKKCDCLIRIYNRLLTEDLSSLMLSGDESFEHFDLSLYPAEYDFNLGTTPREFMRKQMESCRNYATSFPGRLPSLLMQGGTGLGKTYLSACIARVVSEKGCSVCYDTAVSAFEAYEKLRFSKDPEETDQYNAKIRRMLDCDLMILDDLGTELVTSVTVSALYNLINTRLLCGKPTIISTNCTDEELNRKYSPQICSRLLGEFRKVPFCGNDIRLLRKGH